MLERIIRSVLITILGALVGVASLKLGLPYEPIAVSALATGISYEVIWYLLNRKAPQI